jgi:polyisoprenoid-binding protein YceI
MGIQSLFPRAGFLGLLLLSSVTQAATNQEELCAPFSESAVDPSLIAMMLRAAEEGGLYRIQSSNSSVGFCAQSLIGRIEAEFTTFQGGVSLMTVGQGEETQALVRVDTHSLKTRGPLLDLVLKSESFLHVDAFPEILFIGTGLRWITPTRGVLEGELTLHGVTRAVVFEVELLGSDEASLPHAEKVKVKATTTIRPSEFGMERLPSLTDDSVDLCLQVEAVRHSI